MRTVSYYSILTELKAVAILLGVPYISLFRGLTKKLKVMKSDATIQSCSAAQVWCGMVYGVWYGMVYGVVWHMVWCVVWYMVWSVVWYMVWCVVWYGIWCSMVYGVVWYMVWYGIWYGR